MNYNAENAKGRKEAQKKILLRCVSPRSPRLCVKNLTL